MSPFQAIRKLRRRVRPKSPKPPAPVQPDAGNPEASGQILETSQVPGLAPGSGK
jgi:hypothetical protein